MHTSVLHICVVCMCVTACVCMCMKCSFHLIITYSNIVCIVKKKKLLSFAVEHTVHEFIQKSSLSMLCPSVTLPGGLGLRPIPSFQCARNGPRDETIDGKNHIHMEALN